VAGLAQAIGEDRVPLRRPALVIEGAPRAVPAPAVGLPASI